MEKIYANPQALKDIEEPLKTVLFMINELYVKAPEGCNKLPFDLPDYLVVNCVECICKDIKDEPLRIPRVLKKWHNTVYKKGGMRKNDHQDFCVPISFEFVTILGGVYYVLATGDDLDEQQLSLIEAFSNQSFPNCTKQFDLFKQAALQAPEKHSSKSILTAKEGALMAEVLAKALGLSVTNKMIDLAPLGATLSGATVLTVGKRFSEGYVKADRDKVSQLFTQMSALSQTLGKKTAVEAEKTPVEAVQQQGERPPSSR